MVEWEWKEERKTHINEYNKKERKKERKSEWLNENKKKKEKHT